MNDKRLLPNSKKTTLDDFEKESRTEVKNEELKQERKIVHPSKDNIPEKIGTITYTFYEGGWYIVLGDLQIGAFTKRIYAEGWAQTFIGRKE